MPPSRAMHPAVQAAFFVERYAVYDEFAAGGMATVHFARLNGAHGFRRTVAVKRLLPHLTRDQDFALMLIDEARLASRVRHHNVVSTLDVVQTADELLLVMEYVHGESLAKLARWSAERREPIPVDIAAALMSDALHGLHAAHEAKDEHGVALGLVHRDVSPQNVLVGLDGITRIADFGVAKAAGRAHSTRDGAIKGKLAYMAPEQLSGEEVSRVSDVFAAAVVLWEVLTGECLFAGSNHAETVFKVMSAPIPRPSARRAELSQALEAVVLRGLERDPTRRYATAQEMALALESAVPPVRSSEIASWVERIAADRLTQRARILRAIESSAESEAPAHMALHEHQPRRGAWNVVASALPQSELETGTHRKEPVSQRAPTELAANVQTVTRSAPTATSTPAGGRLLGGGLIALLALLGVVTLRFLSRSEQVSSPAPSEQREASATPAALDQSAPTDAPSTLLLAPTSPPADAAVSLREPSREPSSKTRAATPNAKHRVRSTHKGGERACDPPYTIDQAGRVLFKVECM